MNSMAIELEKSDISDSMSGAGKVQHVTGTYHYPRKKEGLKNGWRYVKKNIVANLKEVSLTRFDTQFEHQNNHRNGLDPTE